MISISGFYFLFLFPSDVVTFSMDGGVILGVSQVVFFYLIVCSFSISSSIISLELEGWTVCSSSRIYLVDMVHQRRSEIV